MKKLIFFICLFINSTVLFAKDNFYMRGKFTDLNNDTLIVSYAVEEDKRSEEIKQKVPVTNGKFTFSADLNEAKKAHFMFKSKTNQGDKSDFYLFIVPEESVVIEGTIKDFSVDGTAFYKDLAQVMLVKKPFTDEQEAIDEKYAILLKAESADEESLKKTRNKEMIAINKRFGNAVYEYIKLHPDKEATVDMLISLELRSILKGIELLTPAVRNGRFSGYIYKLSEFVKMVTRRTEAFGKIKEGAEAPDFTLKDDRGNDFTLSSLRGKYVVLDFWGSWCKWCIAGFPKMKELYAKYKEKVEIVGIDCQDTDQKWRAALKDNQLPWLQVFSGDRNIDAEYAVKGYPCKVVIAPDGKILKLFTGENNEFYTYVKKLIK